MTTTTRPTTPINLTTLLVAILVFATCTLTSLSGLLSKREITRRVSSLPTARATTASAGAGMVGGGGVASDGSIDQPITNQVVLVLLDALRPDFVFPSLEPYIREGSHGCEGLRGGGGAEGNNEPSVTTRPSLTALQTMLADHPHDTLATFLIADAPTTTSQRLKAIMTGTIPAFIEGGANFNSDEVVEDSLLWQLRNRRRCVEGASSEGRASGHGDGNTPHLCQPFSNGVEKARNAPEANDAFPTTESDTPTANTEGKAHANAVVLGDDTWLTLFNTNHWQEHVVFPSFDVRDLDGNDAMVMANMERVLRAADPARREDEGASERREKDDTSTTSPQPPPSLIVMHFLGIDHAGHSYHAYHPEMERKLTEINTQLAAILRVLEERVANSPANVTTTLVVMGDHGMTNSGDHGGDFAQETDTLAITRVFRGKKGGEGDAVFAAKATTRHHISNPHVNASAYAAMARQFIDRKWQQCAEAKAGGREEHPTCRFRRCSAVAAKEALTTAGSSLPHPTPTSSSSILTSSHRIGAAYQIDIVPTLASLLGIGIPYSNMGSVIPEVLALVGDASSSELGEGEVTSAARHGQNLMTNTLGLVAKAAKRNLDQMHAYLGVGEDGEGTSNGGNTPSKDTSSNNGNKHIRDTFEALGHMARLASGVRRSRAQMKVDRIFVGAVGGIVWCVVLLGWFTMRTTGWLVGGDGHKRGGGMNAPLIFAAATLLLVGVAIMLDLTWLTLGASVVAVVAGCLALPWGRRAPAVGSHTTKGSLQNHLITTTTITAAAIITLLTVIRIIPPFSNSFVVFEDTIIQWLLCLTIVGGMMLMVRGTVGSGKSSSSRRRIITCGVLLMALTRFLGACGTRSRRHHTHTIDALSPLDSYLLLSFGWDGNLKGGALTELLYYYADPSVGALSSSDGFTNRDGSNNNSGWCVDHFVLMQLLIRLGFNMLSIGGLLMGSGGGGGRVRYVGSKGTAVGATGSTTPGAAARQSSGGGASLFVAPATVTVLLALILTAAEGIALVHHFVGVGFTILLAVMGGRWFGLVGGGGAATSSSLAATAFGAAWASTLSTTPSARLTAALVPLALRSAAGMMSPCVVNNNTTSTATAKQVGREGGAPTESSAASPAIGYLLSPFLFHLLGWCLFFASGQQTVISTLDWGAAFVGVSGFNFLLCGALVVVRTFSPFVLSIVVPLAVWAAEGGGDRGNLSVAKGQSSGAAIIAPSFLLGSLLHQSLATAASVLAAGILRMHLMMWSIFCPKMLYDVILWGIVLVVVMMVRGILVGVQ